MKNRIKTLALVLGLGMMLSITALASSNSENIDPNGTQTITSEDGGENTGGENGGNEGESGSGEGGGNTEDTHNCSDFKVVKSTTNASCTAPGEKTFECSKCHADLGKEPISQLDHNYNGTVTVTKPATCFSKGTKTIQCTGCTATKSEEIGVVPHQMSGWQSYSKAANCKEKDKEINKCLTKDCTHQEIRETSTKGPCEEKSERKNVKNATCKEEGYSGDVVCKNCDRVLTKGSNLTKTDHIASSTLKNKLASTCDKEGYSGDLVCKYCDTVMEKGVALVKKDHEKASELKNIKESTCKEEGYTGDEVCKNCSTVLKKGEKTTKKDHVDSEELKNRKDATCSVAGYSGDVVCKNCNEITKKGSATLTISHTPKLINAKQASCKDEGYTGDEVCEKCAMKLSIGKNIPRTNSHQFGEWTVIQEATETAKGTETRECIVCHNVESRNIPKLGETTTEKPVVNTPEEELPEEEEDVTTIPSEDEEMEDPFADDIVVEKKGMNPVVKIVIAVGLVGILSALGVLIYFKKFK